MNDGCLTFIFFGIIFLIMLGISAFTDIAQCSATGNALGYKTEWHYFTGCTVTKPDGSKVLLKQMRDMER